MASVSKYISIAYKIKGRALAPLNSQGKSTTNAFIVAALKESEVRPPTTRLKQDKERQSTAELLSISVAY